MITAVTTTMYVADDWQALATQMYQPVVISRASKNQGFVTAVGV